MQTSLTLDSSLEAGALHGVALDFAYESDGIQYDLLIMLLNISTEYCLRVQLIGIGGLGFRVSSHGL